MTLKEVVDFCSKAESCVPVYLVKIEYDFKTKEEREYIQELTGLDDVITNSEVDYYDFDVIEDELICLVKLK